MEGQRAVDEARLYPLPLVLQICQASVDHFQMNPTMALEHLAVRRLLCRLVLLGGLAGLGIHQIAE